MKGKKAQVALEYLMTYGWALIAIVIIAAVLFAIGILNPEAYQAGTCRGFGKIGYFSHVADASNLEFKIILGNGSGADIAKENATVSIDVDQDGTFDNSTTNSTQWRGAELYTFTLDTSGFTQGERYTVDVKIVFTPENGLEQEETAVCTGIAK